MPKAKKTNTPVKPVETSKTDEVIAKLSPRGKTAMMAVMLTKEEGTTIKQLAKELQWKENSVRGALSTLSKAQKDLGFKITSEIKDGERHYHLVPEKE